MVLSSKFEQLSEGDTFVTASRTVTESDLLSFAACTGAGHGDGTAPAPFTLALAFGLMHADPGCAIALRGMTDVLFTRPVRIGDALTVNGRVASLAPLSADTGVVGLTLVTANQHRKTVCRARLQLLWRRDS